MALKFKFLQYFPFFLTFSQFAEGTRKHKCHEAKTSVSMML